MIVYHLAITEFLLEKNFQMKQSQKNSFLSFGVHVVVECIVGLTNLNQDTLTALVKGQGGVKKEKFLTRRKFNQSLEVLQSDAIMKSLFKRRLFSFFCFPIFSAHPAVW